MTLIRQQCRDIVDYLKRNGKVKLKNNLYGDNLSNSELLGNIYLVGLDVTLRVDNYKYFSVYASELSFLERIYIWDYLRLWIKNVEAIREHNIFA